MNQLGATLIGGLGLLIGLATITVLISQKAQTSSVIQALGTGVASDITAATAPLTAGNNA